MLEFEMKENLTWGYLSEMDNSDGIMSLERQRNHHLLQFKTLFFYKSRHKFHLSTLQEKLIQWNIYFLECPQKMTTWPQLKTLIS